MDDIQRKKIVIVVHHYPPHISGVGQVAYNHAKHLHSEGNEVVVITSDTGPLEKSKTEDGIKVVRVKALNFSEGWSAPFPIFSPTLLLILQKYIKHADIVHVHDAFYISSFCASLIAKRYKKPLLLTQHVAMIAHPSKVIVQIQKIVYATTGKLIFRLSNRIFTFNTRIEQFLIGKGVPREKLMVMFNGVDTDLFHPVTGDEKNKLKKKIGLDTTKKVILFVGRYVPKKGFDKVLNARSSEYQIVCVGGDALQKDFGDHVVFLGKVNQKSLAEIYQASDIFLLPSESEGFPLSVQEAMASGLPIITTNDPGYAQYNFDTKKMCLIDSANEAVIQETIYRIYNDEDLLQKMSAYSQSYAIEHFNWAITISKLNKIYNGLLTKEKVEKRPRRLVVVAPYFYPKIGGLENIAYNTAKSLHQSGKYVVSVITSNHYGKGYRQDVVDGMVVHRLPISFILSNSPINPLWYWQIKKIFKKEHPDLIHVHSPVPYIADMAVYAAGKVPVVMTYHSGSMRKNKWPIDILILTYEKIVLRTVFRKVTAIVAYSPEFIQGELAPLSYKTHVIPPGVDLSRFIPTPLPSQKMVTFVGRMEHATKWKGIETLLEAMSFVVKKYPDARLQLVGGGDALDFYKDRAQELGISNSVVFCGPQTGAALTKAYEDSRVIVLPSISNAESFGMVLVEAMASGRPVVGSNIGGIPQLIDHERNGLLVTPKDAQALAEAIERMLGDTTFAEKCAAEAIHKAQQFSWNIQVEKYEKLFNTILKPKQKKVALVSDAVYPYNKGGKEKRIYDISTRLALRDFDVTIYCMKWWQGGKSVVKDGVTFYAISPFYPLYSGKRRSIKEGVFFALNCLKLLVHDFDVIEVDHIPHLVLFTVKVVCILKRKKMIVTWHEVWGKKYWQEYLGGVAGTVGYIVEKMSAQLPDTIISVSNHTTQALRNTLHSNKKIETISNGFDIGSIHTTRTSTINVDVIYAGRLLAHKHIDVLLRAVKILAEQGKKLSVCIIGEGPERSNLEELAQTLGVEKQVVFHNFMDDYQDLYATLQASKVFAFPSTREGFGIVVLEANACGLPVITVDHPENAARELIVDGKNGVLTTLDQQAIADAITRALDLKAKNSDYNSYVTKYEWNTLVNEVVKVYE